MNRRDIELLISAKDTTGRTFQTVAQNINELAETINRQAEAAARGELSLDKLQATQEKLGDVGKELAAIQGLIDTYEKLGGVVERDSTQLAELQAKQAALTQTIAGAGTATAAQERTLAGYEKRIASLTTTLANNRTAFTAQGAALEAAGLDANKLAAAQDQIVSSATRVGQGLVVAKNGVQQFDRELFNATQASIRAGDAVDLSFVPSTLRLKALADQARNTGQAIDTSFANKGVQFQENTRLINAMVVEMQRAEKQAQESALALANFQQIGRDAQVGAGDVSRFIPDGASSNSQLDAVANGLRAIIAPGQAAMQTLDGVETAVAGAAATAGNSEARVSEYSNALNKLSESAASIVRQGSLIDSFRDQAQAVEAAGQRYNAAEADLDKYAKAVESATEPNAELAQKLKDAQAAVTASGRAFAAEQVKLGQLSQKLKAAAIDSTALDEAQKRLEEAATAAAEAEGELNKTLGREGETPNGLFGLNPYDLQNLGFQVNDVITSIASGNGVLQTLFQQGGQITQLFPGLVSQIGAFGLAWSAVLIPIAAVVAVLAGVANRAAEVELFTKALNARVDGGLYDPKNLEMVSRGMQDIGVAAADAQATVLAFVDAGLDASKLEAYSQAAADMATALGVDVADATTLLIGVLNGGSEAVSELNEKTNVLTDAELQHADALFDSGKAAEARQYVFDRAAEKLDDIAARARGPWSTGVNNLRVAWSNMLDFFGRLSVFQRVRSQIDDVSIGFAFLTGLLAGKSVQQAGQEAVAASKAASGAVADQTRARQRQLTVDRSYLENLRDTTVETKNLTKAERVALAQRDARRAAANAGLSDAAIAEAARIAGDAEGKKADEAQGKRDSKASRAAAAAQKRAEAAQRKAQAEAEAAANRIKAAQAELVNQQRTLLGKTGRGDSASLEERLAGVNAAYGKIFDSIQKLRDLGITKGSDGQDLAVIEADAKAAQERAVTEERLKYFEEQTNLLIKQRAEEVAGIADDQKRGAINVADAFRAAEESNSRLSPQIVDAARKALEIARAVAGTKPNAEMTALIAKLERIIAGEGTGNILTTVQADVGVSGLAKQEADLNKLLADRNALVESYNTLAALGLLTTDQAREKTAAAYNSTAAGITQQTTAIRATIDLLREQGIITGVVYDTWIAKIEAVNAGTANIDTRITEINNVAQAAIANGVVSAFQTAANSIYGLISGTMSFGEAIGDVFRNALGFIADFIQQIAVAILRMLVLKAIEASLGAPGGGGGLGGLFFHEGGVVGKGGSRRSGGDAPASVWARAPRLHSGGGLGIGPDEYRAVLKRNEEVLTENDPRNVLNGGGLGQGPAGGQDPSLKQVLVLDPNEIPRAMMGKPGQRTILTVIRTNAETIKQSLGIK